MSGADTLQRDYSTRSAMNRQPKRPHRINNKAQSYRLIYCDGVRYQTPGFSHSECEWLEPIAHYYFTELKALHGHAAFSHILDHILHQEISRHRDDLIKSRTCDNVTQGVPLDGLGFEMCDPILMHDFSGNWLGGRHVKLPFVHTNMPEVEKFIADIFEKRSREAQIIAEMSKRNAKAQKQRMDAPSLGG